MTALTTFFPAYDFSPQLNAGYLKEILPLMVQHNIAANPINYAVCYDYVAGGNAALTQAFDQLASEKKMFDAETSTALYAKYICNASAESFEKINLQLQKVIDRTSLTISDTCTKAEETNDSFQKKTAILETLSPDDGVSDILQDIIRETKALAAASLMMQAQLNEANAKLDSLRRELTEVRQVAETDGLTGLLNRRAFDRALTEIVNQPSTGKTYLSILDIDHFKRINDTYGHTIGDNVIKYVAGIMKKYADSHHRIARYGGEEMAIIMPETSSSRAQEISENIRACMENSRLKRKDNNQPLGTITLSIGLAELQNGDDTESFIVRADKALYQAKQNGRNKVVRFQASQR